ncbi:MAG: hypothetical protein VX768_20365 [Planctomycetota bacterium]|nr:hypothetical protein [Planctomycetota bacterium]
MPSQPKNFLLILSLLLFFWGSQVPGLAMQDDPFGDPFGGGAAKQKQGNDDPFGGGGDDPFNPGGNKPAGKGPGNRKAGNAALPKTVDKVVLAIRETSPSTPSEFMQALRIMFDTQNYDEAKVYLGKLEAAKVSDTVAYDLIEEIGSDFIIRLIRSKPMAPQGAAYGRNLLAASTRHLKSDAQLGVYFGDLLSDSPTRRNNAGRGFQLAGNAGLAYLVKSASGNNQPERSSYEIAAALIGSTIVRPLEAVLESGDEKQIAFSISVLGRKGSRQSVPYLLGFLLNPQAPASLQEAAKASFGRILGGLPERAEAKSYLGKKLNDLIKGARPFPVNADGRTEHWTWTADGKFSKQMVVPEVAQILMMERLARTLFSIDPEDAASERLYLASQLSTLKAIGNKTLEEAIAAGSLSKVPATKWIGILEFCMKNNLIEGATGAVEIIGNSGDESIMRTSGFSPLLKAMQMGDRDLRYSSTKAIINLDPKRSFPGASHFLDSVVYFAGTQGQPRALIAHPRFAEGQNLVGLLARRGFDADAVTTGRDLFRLASQDSDVEFILVSDAIDRPSLGELMIQLRSQPALATIPIGILSQKMNHERNVRIAEADPNAMVMKQPYRISFRVEQILPEDNREVNNAIITWSVLSDLLEQALEQNNRSICIQMLETMRASFNDNLSKLAVDNSTIVDAMKHPDQAIRSRASKLFTRVTGEKPLYEKPVEQPTTSGRVLIVHPQSGDILPLQQKLTEVGYTVAVVNSVDQAVKVIPGLPSLKFVIGSREFGGLAETALRNALAKKFRLNPTPITFVERADSYREAPVAKPVFDMQLEQLLDLQSGTQTSSEDRIAQAKTCLAFLKKVIADRKSYAYADPIRHEKKIVDSLQNRALTQESLGVLGELATPMAQKAIVDLASEINRPLKERNAAVQALAVAIRKRGILLTKADILEQYARYNRSETLDQQTQQVLGSILDVIEAPRQAN